MANRILTAHGEAFAIRPLHDRVFVKRLETSKQEGLIWLPDVAQENSKRAIVVAIGPEVYGVKPGDEVLLPGAAHKYPDWEMKDYMMVEQDDIGGVFQSYEA